MDARRPGQRERAEAAEARNEVRQHACIEPRGWSRASRAEQGRRDSIPKTGVVETMLAAAVGGGGGGCEGRTTAAGAPAGGVGHRRAVVSASTAE